MQYETGQCPCVIDGQTRIGLTYVSTIQFRDYLRNCTNIPFDGDDQIASL